MHGIPPTSKILRSIQDQVAYIKEILTMLGLTDVEIIVLYDEGISGEVVSRPGIDEVRAGIPERRFDIIFAEDSSRLFRHETACFELVEMAVDEDIRVICWYDYVDTAEEDWDARLHDAQRQHTQSNRYTSRRIKRAHSGLWGMGAAIGLLRPGYRRRPSVPPTDREPACGPFFDEIDPEWESTVHEAFERIASGQSTRSVAQWLTSTGLPKTSNSKSEAWSDRNVISLIRRMVYRGVEERGKTVSKKKRRSGQTKQVPNDPERVQFRNMPHLRIVSDHLWYAANDAVDAARLGPKPASGRDNAQYGIPRESRMPLSKVFVCACCEAKMHSYEPNGYFCSRSRKCIDHPCWNKASAKREHAHQAIRDALLLELGRLAAIPATAWKDAVQKLLGDDRQRDKRKSDLENEIRHLETVLENLNDVAEQGQQDKLRLARRIEKREGMLDRKVAKLEDLQSQQDSLQFRNEEIADRIGEIQGRLQRMEQDVQADLKLLVGTIQAVPCRQFGCDKVVLRGRFNFQPSALLPTRIRLALQNTYGDKLPEHLPEWLQPVSLCVNLFEPSTGPKYGLEAERLDREEQLGLTAIGRGLGINKRKANIAVQYGRQLRNAGLTDPFTELSECPASASRWKVPKPNNTTASDHAESLASGDDPATH